MARSFRGATELPATAAAVFVGCLVLRLRPCFNRATMNQTTNLTNLIPESILASIRRRGRKGMSLAMLVAEVDDERGGGRSDARRALRGVLKELERRGEIVLGRGKRYFPAEDSDLHPGRYRG